MTYKLFFNAQQINPVLSVNPFGEYLPRAGDSVELRIKQFAVGPTYGDDKMLAIVKVDKVRFHIETTREDGFKTTSIHISVSIYD